MTAVFESPSAWRDERRAQIRAGLTLGFVPTMGALHEGHLSLVRRSRAENDRTLVSIFVNPTQFDNPTDLTQYPRTLEDDLTMLRDEGTEFVLVPGEAELYRDGFRYRVTEIELSKVMEGACRPGHFDGVLTVVLKLLQIASAERAYFGEKDWQQLAVIRRMAADLSFPVEVVGCPTVREPDGLAMSSRNAYLTPDERAAAPVVHWALVAGAAAIAAGERDPGRVRALVGDLIRAEPLAALDYAEVVDIETLQEVDPLAGKLRLLAAVRFGRARLIDNEGATAAAPT